MPAGRPRTTTPSPEECIELGKKLVAWASEKTPPDEPLRSRFCEWYTSDGIDMIAKEWELLIAKPEFQGYYEKARALLGRKFIDGTINPSIGHRLMWHYVPESKEQEIEKIRQQAKAKAEYEGENLKEIVLQVSSGLAAGSNLRTKKLPTSNNKST